MTSPPVRNARILIVEAFLRVIENSPEKPS